MKFSLARKITVAAAFVLVIVGLIFNTGTGTLSSFGWQQIAAICPLGVIEGFLANKTIFGRALIVLGITLIFFGFFGKVFCSWLCPVPSLKDLVERAKTKVFKKKAGSTPLTEAEKASLSVQGCSGAAGCSSCAEKRKKFDSRHIVLGGTLLSAAIFGFPVFCLICPIGLTFGTIIIFWQWVGFNDISFSLLIYPAILVIELVVLRKWCAKFCPLGALLSLMSLPNRFFRPKVNMTKCLWSQGVDCTVCREACPEGLDPHTSDGMNECSKCGLCIEKCPTAAISLPFRNKEKVKQQIPK